MTFQMSLLEYIVSVIGLILGIYAFISPKKAVGIFIFLCVLAGGGYVISTGKNPAYFLQTSHQKTQNASVSMWPRGHTGKARLESLPFDPEIIRRARSGGLDAAYGRLRLQNQQGGYDELELYEVKSPDSDSPDSNAVSDTFMEAQND